MKTSSAQRNTNKCPKCRDHVAVDRKGRGFVLHKTNPTCSFERGKRDQ